MGAETPRTAEVAPATTFVDTNVLVYAHDRSDPAKHAMAAEHLARLWEERTGVLSTQVLQEFYVVATTKLKPPMAPSEAREIIEVYGAWPVVLIEPALILTASRLGEERRLAFWDALIIEGARVAGAVALLTEDLQPGQDFDGVRVVSPF